MSTTAQEAILLLASEKPYEMLRYVALSLTEDQQTGLWQDFGNLQIHPHSESGGRYLSRQKPDLSGLKMRTKGLFFLVPFDQCRAETLCKTGGELNVWGITQDGIWLDITIKCIPTHPFVHLAHYEEGHLASRSYQAITVLSVISSPEKITDRVSISPLTMLESILSVLTQQKDVAEAKLKFIQDQLDMLQAIRDVIK